MRKKIEEAALMGLLNPDQVLPLLAFLEDGKESSDQLGSALQISEDEEPIKFVGGFNDLFVSIGLCLLSAAIGIFAVIYSDKMSYSLYFLGTLILWTGLSELFTKRKSLALSSSVLSLCFAVCLCFFFFDLFGLDRNVAQASVFRIILSSLCASVVMYAHYYRYKVAIDISLVVVCLLACVFILAKKLSVSFEQFTSASVAYGYILTGCAGILTLFLALYFDTKDPLRRTQNADIAFWLHLLSAPLIVHSFFWATGVFLGVRLSTFSASSTVFGFAIAGILVVFLFIGAVAIVIDRRAMLISGLSYCGFAIYTTVETISNSPRIIAIGIALLFLGSGVVILGFGWRPIRKFLLRFVPQSKLHLLPPV